MGTFGQYSDGIESVNPYSFTLSERMTVHCEAIADRIVPELEVPEFRSVDPDDVLDVALDVVVDVVSELQDVPVTNDSVEQAALFMGQRFLRDLELCERFSIGQDIANLLKNTGKTFLVAVSAPGTWGANNG